MKPPLEKMKNKPRGEKNSDANISNESVAI